VKILLTSHFSRDVKRLTDQERAEVEAALNQLADAFGDAHKHAGLGIRKLKRNLFECRAGLRLRILFFASKGECLCDGVGDHAYVRAFLKNIRA
jgi:hypothetical protein